MMMETAIGAVVVLVVVVVAMFGLLIAVNIALSCKLRSTIPQESVAKFDRTAEPTRTTGGQRAPSKGEA
jgi:hypothetical protein